MFGVKELTFLGHHVSSSLIRPHKDEVQTVQDFPRPYTQRNLHEFLGFIKVYHRFLHHGAAILKLLNDLLAAPTGRKKELAWTNMAVNMAEHHNQSHDRCLRRRCG